MKIAKNNRSKFQNYFDVELIGENLFLQNLTLISTDEMYEPSFKSLGIIIVGNPKFDIIIHWPDNHKFRIFQAEYCWP